MFMSSVRQELSPTQSSIPMGSPLGPLYKPSDSLLLVNQKGDKSPAGNRFSLHPTPNILLLGDDFSYSAQDQKRKMPNNHSQLQKKKDTLPLDNLSVLDQEIQNPKQILEQKSALRLHRVSDSYSPSYQQPPRAGSLQGARNAPGSRF